MDALPEFELLRPTELDEVLAARAAHPDAAGFSAAAPISWSTSAAASWRRRC